MNVSLTPQLETWVNDKVESGLYGSASEVVREALRLLREQEEFRSLRVRELRREITLGIDQLEMGQRRPFDDEAVKSVQERGRKKREASGRKATRPEEG